MGTDIHGVVQVKSNNNNNKWVTVEELDLGRNYALFAVLADVRNGYGFGGCSIFKPLEPIVEPRGSPEDLDPDEYIGDYAYSWLTLREISKYDWNQVITKKGYVSLEEIAKTPEGKPYNSYCGWTDALDYEYREWETILKDEIDEKFLDIIERYRDNLDDVRIVFGFDS